MGEEKRDAFVYRICPEAEWKVAEEIGAYQGGALDNRDGFIHMSTIEQVGGTLSRIFAGRNDLYLLKIDTSKIAEGLQYDEVEGIGEFPHFYGPAGVFAPLPLEAVADRVKLELVGGKHVVPF